MMQCGMHWGMKDSDPPLPLVCYRLEMPFTITEKRGNTNGDTGNS